MTLSVENLSYHINGKALVKNVNFTLQAGEVLAVVGQNGAGKSTLLNLLGSEFAPSSGTIKLDGKSLDDYSNHDLALKRAVMAQRALLAFEFTVYEVAMMGRYPHQRLTKRNAHADEEIVLAALQKTETDHLKHRFFPTLSGGESARVTLARVLAQDTPLLLLDEPTASLDLRHQQLVMQIARILAKNGAAIMVVLHDLNLAAAFADRIAMMRDGEIVALGAPADILTAENIEAVFDLPVTVIPHPQKNRPLIVALEPNSL